MPDALAGVPIALVIGNHDFYHGSFAGVTLAVRALCAARPGLHWLGGTGPLPLSERLALV